MAWFVLELEFGFDESAIGGWLGLPVYKHNKLHNETHIHTYTGPKIAVHYAIGHFLLVT